MITAVSLFSVSLCAEERSAPLIVDHTGTALSDISAEWIDTVREEMKLHYAHTSHGGQVTEGLSIIERNDSSYKVAINDRYLPGEEDALCILYGQEIDSYITPDEYWETRDGIEITHSVLKNNPTINVSMWSWCCQLDYYSEARVQSYLDTMTELENAHPEVTFIYMTGNAQKTGFEGFVRYVRNEQVRQYCIRNNKVLFDFADMDSWWFNTQTNEWEHATYYYDGKDIPTEHPQFHGSDAGHTTFGSCEQKGRALWWMMAKLAGWQDFPAGIEDDQKEPNPIYLGQNHPNPFNASTSIGYTVDIPGTVELIIYNLSGQRVRTLFRGERERGFYSMVWDGTDDTGTSAPSGLYLYQINSPNGLRVTRKMMYLK